jgi:hypothetical protein
MRLPEEVFSTGSLVAAAALILSCMHPAINPVLFVPANVFTE